MIPAQKSPRKGGIMKILFLVLAGLVMLQSFTSIAHAKKAVPAFDDETENILIESRVP